MSSSHLTVALAQIAPVWLDREGTTEKIAHWIDKAGQESAELVVFGAFEFDPRTLELRRAGARLNLPPQPARLLALLVERPGELVTREEIRHALWDDDVVVTSHRISFSHGTSQDCVTAGVVELVGVRRWGRFLHY